MESTSKLDQMGQDGIDQAMLSESEVVMVKTIKYHLNGIISKWALGIFIPAMGLAFMVGTEWHTIKERVTQVEYRTVKVENRSEVFYNWMLQEQRDKAAKR